MHRALALIAVASATGAALFAGWLAPLDVALRDLRFQLDHRTPSGQIAFVEIDARSLEAVGVWPWPRRVHAELVTRLLDLGAAEVALDIDFSTRSNEADDAALEQALSDAGGYAILAGFRQLARNGDSGELTRPLPRFARHATVAGVNVSTDNAGIVRSVPYVIAGSGTTVPSLPLALAAIEPPAGGTEFIIDYSIDADLIDRIPVADLLAGTVERARIEDRQVVVGASALELRDVMMTPTAGPRPGGLIQILAAESVLQGRALPPPNPWHSLVLVAFAAALLLLLGRRLTLWSGLAAALGLSAAVEAAAFILQSQAGLLIATAPVHLLTFGAVVAALALEAVERRRLHLEAARQRTEALERLAHAATYDAATGVLTRQAFLEQIAVAHRAGEAVAVVSLKLERFERLAALLGSEHTNPALQEVVRRLETLAPLAIGRIGAETLVMLLRAVDCEQIVGRLPQLLDAAFTTGDHRIILSASIGFARAEAEQMPLVPETLLNHAEVARAAAQSSRMPAPMVYRRDLEQSFNEARELEVALREAIAAGAITAHMQGQFALASGQLCGAEALARWSHPRFGNVSPARFVPLAEQAGLALSLGGHMLEAACRSAVQWHAPFRLAVNVSPAQFEFDDVPALLERTLTATGLDPARLDIEITEGLVLKAHPSTIDVLKAIRAMGVGIALDDFGTGYSSLSYLGTLPINKLKIDQSFVRRLFDETRVQIIVEGILALCASLDITVVAEGIETEPQADWLRVRNCDIGQGFLFHRPAPAAEFSRLVQHFGDAGGTPLMLSA